MSNKIIPYLILILFLTANAFAQKKCKILSFSKVSIDVLQGIDQISKEDIEISDVLKKKLRSTSLQLVNDRTESEFEFLIKAKPTDQEDELIVTLVIWERIPREIIEIGEKEEALFRVIGQEEANESTEEGKQIRQMLSKGYMQTFGLIYNCYLEKINRTEVEKFCEEVIQSFLSTEKK